MSVRRVEKVKAKSQIKRSDVRGKFGGGGHRSVRVQSPGSGPGLPPLSWKIKTPALVIEAGRPLSAQSKLKLKLTSEP